VGLRMVNETFVDMVVEVQGRVTFDGTWETGGPVIGPDN